MIYITESHHGESSVTIKVEGSLDGESLPVMEGIYRKHLESGKKIALDFEDIHDIDRAGKSFLKKIENEVQFVGLPLHIQMEIGSG